MKGRDQSERLIQFHTSLDGQKYLEATKRGHRRRIEEDMYLRT